MLGKGGMGTVYLGEHTLIGSRVAVKFLHPHLVGERTLVERFVAEATAVNQIRHENIVSIFDLSYLPPDRWYLVMEYLEGQPLSALVGAPMSPEVSVPILFQACDALQAAHAANVVHRDLKPENVFLVRRGPDEHFVKLVDFGIAKLGVSNTEQGKGLTAAGLVVGTPEYMSPEQWMGDNIDGRSDLYGLGILAYLMATGRLPFRESTPLAYYTAHRDKQPEPPRRYNPALSEAYEAVILKALAKRPEDRFQVAFEMREALRRAVGTATPAPLGRTPTPSPARPSPSPAPLAAPVPPPPLPARISGPGFAERTLAIADLSRAGLFVRADPPLPELMCRVKLALLHPQRAVELEADVVRHIDAAQAKAWNLPGPGFAVQFVGVQPALRQALTRMVEGRPLEAEGPPP
ncbi:MAG: protein kinase, partial [Deltaproteobacteria bacterium]|nr:protein kinase [Deltaproteobacteria bacterium]